MDDNEYTLYTDGSCLGNPGPGGVGVYLTFPSAIGKPPEKVFRGFHVTTNNRMELRAAIMGLKLLRERSKNYGRHQVVWYTDSQYVADNIYNVPKWRQKKKWLTQGGEPVLNEDLWKELEAVRSSLRIYPQWIPREKNSEADKLAGLGSRNPGYTDFGYNPGKVGASVGKKKNRAPIFFEKDADVRIRVYKGDGQVSRRDPRCKIRFEIVKEDGSIELGSHYIYTSMEIYNDLHRHHKYVVEAKGGEIVGIVEELE